MINVTYSSRFKNFSGIQVAQLDPRPTVEAKAVNDAVFAAGSVLGIEVTIPELAACCDLGNIDPQHSGGDTSLAAIEAALEYGDFWTAYRSELAEADKPTAVLVTVRPDLDSVGALAIIAIRMENWIAEREPYGFPMYCTFEGNTARRIRAVANSDKFSREKWSGKQAFPTAENPWPEGKQASIEASELAAIAACVSDFKQPFDDRVAAMKRWLWAGTQPEGYLEKVTDERMELIQALERGDIQVETFDRVAVVETTHRAATLVGYCVAPVVVALNPHFRFQGGDEHRKFTICQHEAGHVNLNSVLSELERLETGWGGSPTIIGSPQGVSSVLTIDQIVSVVESHLQ